MYVTVEINRRVEEWWLVEVRKLPCETMEWISLTKEEHVRSQVKNACIPEYNQDDCIEFIDSLDPLKKAALVLVDCR